MKIAVITLTRQGTKLGEKLCYKLMAAAEADLPVTFNNETQNKYQFHLFVPVKFACPSKSVFLNGPQIYPLRFARTGFGQAGYLPYKPALPGNQEAQRFSFACPLRELVAYIFPKYKGFIFIMAAGIVVRLIAPLLRHKRYDPAVVVMDEQGRFAVSLLSGHLGGANELAIRVAQGVGAQAVITTATDSSNILALDMLAKKMGMTCEPLENIKKINAALVNGEKISLFTEVSLPEALFPENVNLIFEVKFNVPAWPGHSSAVVFITNKIIDVSSLGETPYLFLRPKNLVAGVGCKKGIKSEEVIAALHFALTRVNLAPASVKVLASISLKQKEQGLLQAASQLGKEVKFFTPEEIARCTLNFSQSTFVENTIGVGGICEPAAYLAAKKPARIILPKTVYHGVTIALAVEN